ncbi:hypothetical protein [Sphingobium sp. CR28]|uniref:hypothetical protein n=1 Tax=Sphingobium sp. CR28 TaxID=3400272 RepID=UPI003FEFCCF6
MIELHAHCYYPSYDGYQSSDFPPYKYVRCLKGEAINGYANVRDIDGVQRRIENGKRDVAMAVFAKWAAQKLATIVPQGATLVPIPSSGHVQLGADFTGLLLCQAINQIANDLYPINACLTQQEAVLAASKGGSRKFVDIRDNLVCHSNLAGRPVVLVDDNVSSGNHLKAAKKVLSDHGATNVSHAISAGRTTNERRNNMWAVPSENVDWDNCDLGGGFGVL